MADPIHLETLCQGAKAWNSWREENPEVVPDLTEASLTLSQRQFGPSSGGPINLRDANLEGAVLRYATLTGADLRGANLASADLVHARLDGADLTAADMTDALADHADFAGAILDRTLLTGASFSDARNLTDDQVALAYGDASTLLPATLLPPNEWFPDLDDGDYPDYPVPDSMDEEDDLYAVLGVQTSAKPDEIRAAFRNLVKKYHPDLNPDDAAAQESFKRVSTAYRILGDPAKRVRYDKGEIGSDGEISPDFEAKRQFRRYAYRFYAAAAMSLMLAVGVLGVVWYAVLTEDVGGGKIEISVATPPKSSERLEFNASSDPAGRMDVRQRPDFGFMADEESASAEGDAFAELTPSQRGGNRPDVGEAAAPASIPAPAAQVQPSGESTAPPTQAQPSADAAAPTVSVPKPPAAEASATAEADAAADGTPAANDTAPGGEAPVTQQAANSGDVAPLAGTSVAPPSSSLVTLDQRLAATRPDTAQSKPGAEPLEAWLPPSGGPSAQQSAPAPGAIAAVPPGGTWSLVLPVIPLPLDLSELPPELKAPEPPPAAIAGSPAVTANDPQTPLAAEQPSQAEMREARSDARPLGEDHKAEEAAPAEADAARSGAPEKEEAPADSENADVSEAGPQGPSSAAEAPAHQFVLHRAEGRSPRRDAVSSLFRQRAVRQVMARDDGQATASTSPLAPRETYGGQDEVWDLYTHSIPDAEAAPRSAWRDLAPKKTVRQQMRPVSVEAVRPRAPVRESGDARPHAENRPSAAANRKQAVSDILSGGL